MNVKCCSESCLALWTILASENKNSAHELSSLPFRNKHSSWRTKKQCEKWTHWLKILKIRKLLKLMMKWDGRLREKSCFRLLPKRRKLWKRRSNYENLRSRALRMGTRQQLKCKTQESKCYMKKIVRTRNFNPPRRTSYRKKYNRWLFRTKTFKKSTSSWLIHSTRKSTLLMRKWKLWEKRCQHCRSVLINVRKSISRSLPCIQRMCLNFMTYWRKLPRG